MDEKRKYRYWLCHIRGIGNKKRKKIVEYCGGAKDAYRLSEQQLLSVPGLSGQDVDAIIESRKFWNLDKEAEILDKTGVSMITVEEEGFPERLARLPDSPYALFCKGRLPPGDQKAAAIVGARMCSSYGRSAGLKISEELARRGVAIISGMARGVDSFGHWGALHGGGGTYAVLGCGPDICYPPGGRELYERILMEGGILSEYPPGVRPAPAQFPARNRIISALADVVILVEARRKSGSLITADFALEQGKDVYAVPGRLDDALSAGCNDLIRQGAGILSGIPELLEDMGLASGPPAGESEKEIEKIKNSLEKQELMVYSCFGLYPRNLEELVKMTRISAQELADLLVRLQAKGLIEEYYKNHYRRK